MNGSCLGRELDAPSAVRPLDVPETEIVDAVQVLREPDRTVRRLHRKRLARAAAVVLEVDPAGEILVEDARSSVTRDASEVETFGQADQIAGEAVAAEVARLPDPPLVQLVAQRLVERPAVARAAGVVLAVGAHDQERMVEHRRLAQEIEPAEIVVPLQLDPDQPLLALAGAGRERGEARAPTAIRAADEEEPAVRDRRELAPQRVLDLVGETAAGECIAAPDAAVLDQEPVIDPAGGGVERLRVVAGNVGAERPRARGAGYRSPLASEETTQITWPVWIGSPGATERSLTKPSR
jgi:hypothetical protein